ncbi:hypothetical protein GIB67_033842 [Kingdonia uniflora]|uniref:MADS-box domain-containing protein n=1 Tax=Kingdonia uniflora TaxID=39325 RepID=A0A7J7LIE1_9MAGN|nr:hypothetical protein GIB67_033842 [Kingdonia uniflora]
MVNDSSRRTTYKKREKGLKKKASELSILCGVSACAIIYSQYDPQPNVWPSVSDAHQVISRFRDLPGMEQTRRMTNLESFLRQEISKVEDHLKKLRKENEDADVTNVMLAALRLNANECPPMDLFDLDHFVKILEENRKAIEKRIDGLKKTVETSPPKATKSNNREKRLKSSSLVGESSGSGGGDKCNESEEGNAVLKTVLDNLQKQH